MVFKDLDLNVDHLCQPNGGYAETYLGLKAATMKRKTFSCTLLESSILGFLILSLLAIQKNYLAAAQILQMRHLSFHSNSKAHLLPYYME